MSERLQATVSDAWMKQVRQLEAETGSSTSQLVEEAISLFCTAAREARTGHRVAFVMGERRREFISPTLAQLELSDNTNLTLSNEDFDHFVAVLEKPLKPNAALRRLMRPKR